MNLMYNISHSVVTEKICSVIILKSQKHKSYYYEMKKKNSVTKKAESFRIK